MFKKCEAIENAFKINKRYQAIENLCDFVMPFGRFKGEKLGDVPLSYLDQTISVMPQTWFVRQVRTFVDLTMDTNETCGYDGFPVPNRSWNDLQREFFKDDRD